jgi:hypothetical protein
MFPGRRSSEREARQGTNTIRQKRMKTPRLSDWQLWSCIVCARLPLGLLLEPERIATRTQLTNVSGSAYVHRMFDLFFFPLREPAVIERLEENERKDLEAFLHAFDSLPWQPLPSHSHVCELPDGDFSSLIPHAKRLDHRLWLRSGRSIVPLICRLVRGWPLFEAPLKAKENAHQTPEPTRCARGSS